MLAHVLPNIPPNAHSILSPHYFNYAFANLSPWDWVTQITAPQDIIACSMQQLVGNILEKEEEKYAVRVLLKAPDLSRVGHKPQKPPKEFRFL